MAFQVCSRSVQINILRVCVLGFFSCVSFFFCCIFFITIITIITFIATGPADYAQPGTIGSGVAASLKSRPADLESSDTPGSNAYTLSSTFGVDGAGASMKGRARDPRSEGLPGL